MANPEWDNYDPAKVAAMQAMSEQEIALTREAYIAMLEAENAELRASVISSASPLSEEALRVAFLAGVEDAVGPERCDAEYDAPSREYARRAIDRLSASAPSPEDKGSDNG